MIHLCVYLSICVSLSMMPLNQSIYLCIYLSMIPLYLSIIISIYLSISLTLLTPPP